MKSITDMGRTCSTVFKLTISKFTITLVNIPVVVFYVN